MNEFFANVAYFGVFLSIATYMVGVWLNRRFRSALLNPLLVSVVLCIVILSVFKIDYATFNTGKNNTGSSMLQNLLTPTTVCLAIPLYEKIRELKKNPVAILVGILSGVLANAAVILLLSALFRLSHQQYVTLLPKSITTAIGMDVSTELGGLGNVTAACIIFTGILGNVIASGVLRLCRITDPVAAGLAIGASAHAIGTARARELGKTQEAMSSLSIAVTGLITVVAASFFAMLY